MTTGHVVEIVGGTSSMFSSFGRACLFLYTVAFQRRRSTSAAQKEPKRAPQKSRQARASMVACEQKPCKHHAKHARLHGSGAYATGLPRAMLLLCAYQVRVPAHHLPSRWSQSLRTTRRSGHLENFPILFFIGWLCPRGKRVHNFCFVGSAPEGRDFATSFYCLCPEIRDFTIMFYYCLCPKGKRLYNFVVLALTQRVETLQFCSLALPREKRLHNFVLLNLPRENRNFTILFFFFGSAQREETLQFWFIGFAQETLH